MNGTTVTPVNSDDACGGGARHTLLLVLLLLVGAGGALVVSNNWCFVALPASGAALLTDFAVRAIRPWPVLRLVAAGIVGSAVGALLDVRPDWAFHKVFDCSPPAGVHDVRIQRHYAGGPGEHVLIITFTADASVMAALSAGRAPDPHHPVMERWLAVDGDWTQALDCAVPAAPGWIRRSWDRITPLHQAEICALDEVNAGVLVLFHEPASGRCVALHVRL